MLNVLTEKQTEEVVSRPVGSAAEVSRMKSWLEDRIARGRKTKSTEIVTLTPVLASLLLERNPANRPISKANMSEIEQDVANGRYEFNGQSVIVSDTGILNDGQHRCSAVLKTGVPVETVLVFGATEKSRYTVDTGKSKSVSNFLAMKGRKYTSVLGPAARFLLEYRDHLMILDKIGGKAKVPRASKQAILMAADAIKGVDASVEFTAGCMKTVRNHAVLAFCHHVFSSKSSKENANHFISRLIDGDNLKKGDPILYCRNRLLGMGRHEYASTRIELVFRCWNAWRTDSSIQAFRTTGKLPKVER